MPLLTRRTAPGPRSAAGLRAAPRGVWRRLARISGNAWHLRCRLLLAGGVALLAPALKAVPNENETTVKAALLFNLTQFVEWPPEAFAGPDAPLVIGLLGRDPFGRELDELVQREAPGARPIVVRRFREPREAAQSHVLFVDHELRGRLQQVFAAVGDRPVLTVADFHGFLRRGGVVRFYRNAEHKIRVRINLHAARDARLTISAKLLRVVEIVPPEEE